MMAHAAPFAGSAIRRTALLLVWSFGLIAPAAAQRAAMTVGRMTLVPCNIGYGGYCGAIDRPLDPADPAHGTLSIGFEWYPRRDQARPPLGTIVAQEGGPGYATTGSRDGYVRLFDPLRGRRDILLMDKRGTGRSGALLCPTVQSAVSANRADYAACGARLGPDAYYYATRFAAADLAALLDLLQRPRVDFYGDSYGTYVGQIFARLYPERIRTLTLDSAYPAGGPAATRWYPAEYHTAPRALRDVCARSPRCAGLPGDPFARLDTLVSQVRAHPVIGVAPNAAGRLARATIDPANLFTLLDFAGNSPTNWRDFDAANRALLEGGDALPMLRLVAETISGNGLGGYAAEEFSNGLATAVICADYPQLFDLRAGIAERRRQYLAAVAGKQADNPDLYAPFTIDEAIAAPYQPLEIGVCLGWPAPPDDAPPAPPHGLAPRVPTLVINGELDPVTAVPEGAEVSAYFRSPNYTVVANAIHETAIGDGGEWVTPYGADLARCAGPIVLHFIATAGEVDNGCARAVRPLRPPAAFVRAARQAVPPQALPGNAADAQTLRIASAAAETVGDVIARYYQQGTQNGLGLRGGRFGFASTATGYGFVLDAVRWTDDLAVSGTIAWNQVTDDIIADIRIAGVAQGALRITWNDRLTDAPARITGMIGGAPVAAVRLAP